MLEERITEEELQMMEMFYYPPAMIESLLPENFRAPHLWGEDNCPSFKIRRYQDAMLSYVAMYADDPKLSEKDNYQNKINAGTIYNISARNLGKSVCLWIDAVLNFIYGYGDEGCLASFDYKHLKRICYPVSNYINFHPFLQIFKRPGKSNVRFGAVGFEADNINGYTLYGKNEKIEAGDDAGTDYQGLHFKWFGFEEASFMSVRGTEQRIDAIHSHGVVERLCGIPDLRLNSPLGNLLLNPKNKKFICRLPQSVRNDYTKEFEDTKAEEYGGRGSIGFRLNVLGELIEGAYGKWDMERIRHCCYKTDKKVKWFEINKDNLTKFKNIIVLDKVEFDRTWLCADMGSTAAPTEIILISETNNKYKYRYNITLNKLLIKEQALIFVWLYENLKNVFIGLDSTSAEGRDLAAELISLGVPADKITEVKFNTKMVVGFEKNDKGHVIKDSKGQPIIKEERTIEWAMHELENLFYGSHIEIWSQDKFLAQFTGYVEKLGSNGIKVYGSTCEDHLHSAFQVFAITRFLNEFNATQRANRQKRCLGVI